VEKIGTVSITQESSSLLHSLKIQISIKVSGMCGNFNGEDGDDFKTPTSGDLVETSAKVFGDSWKIDLQCTDDLLPKVL
jgi:von Willebrand factor type D domain